MRKRDRGSGESGPVHGDGGGVVCEHNDGESVQMVGEYSNSSRNLAKETRLYMTQQLNRLITDRTY